MDRRRAKIVCTLGPASSSAKVVDALVEAGMDVARLNFSHGTPEEHASRVAATRRASGRHQKPLAILADLQGPKIRTGALEQGCPVQLRAGKRLIITTRSVPGTAEVISTTFRALPKSVHKGDAHSSERRRNRAARNFRARPRSGLPKSRTAANWANIRASIFRVFG